MFAQVEIVLGKIRESLHKCVDTLLKCQFSLKIPLSKFWKVCVEIDKTIFII